MRTLFIVLAIVVVLGGGYYWYTSQNDMDMDMTPTDTNTQTNTNTNTNTTGSTNPTTKEFTITGSNFKFAPANMNVNEGDTVKITFVNESGTHDLRVDGYNVGTKTLQAGQSETITFLADKTGTFEYYCSIGQHRQMGMKGTLTVTE
jgi:plastocyanin